MDNKTIKMAINRKFPKINYEDNLETAIKTMTAHDVSVLAVKAGEELVGLVTVSDVMSCLAEGHGLQETKLSEFMTTCEFDISKETRNPCLQLDEEQDALSAVKVMHEAGVNHLLVSGADNKAVGIVSSLDLVKLYGTDLLQGQD
jgi:predicted transcriptional regulator